MTLNRRSSFFVDYQCTCKRARTALVSIAIVAVSLGSASAGSTPDIAPHNITPKQLEQMKAKRQAITRMHTLAHGGGLAPADPPNGMVVTTANAATLAATLLGPGVTISGTPTLQGAATQGGTFTGGPSLVGFSTGIILSSGLVSAAASTWVGGNLPSADTGQTGNALLSSLIAGQATNDAAVLSFSFIPTASKIFFSYTFASAEYPVYIGAFNDPMGLFVNGVNVAVLPTAVPVPVTINNVNATTNPSFFNKYNAAGDNLVFGGETKVLTASANVNAGQVNTIVLGVADALDHVLDSAVFIQAGSLSTTAPAAPTGAPVPASLILVLIGVAALGIYVALMQRRSVA
jgi:hypothetical protein